MVDRDFSSGTGKVLEFVFANNFYVFKLVAATKMYFEKENTFCFFHC